MNMKEKQKIESREKILKAASRLFREKGFQATGVDELMEKAGLTAGAFYAHFESKQELLDESLRFCLDKNRSLLLNGLENAKGKEFVSGLLQNYVSSLHRDNPKAGCPLPALGPELYRSSKESSKVISEYLETWIEMVSSHLSGDQSQKREEAIRLFSQAIGGILLSRLVHTEKLSDEILAAARKVQK